MEWKKYKLGEIAEITVGFPFESERFNTAGQGVRLVRGMNVSERYLRFGEDARWWDDISDKLQSYYLKENDIVIGMDGSKVGKNFALVKKDDLPLLLVQRVACIRAKENFDQKYIWHYISSPRFIEYVNTIKTGSSIPHISSSQIFNFPIFTPLFEEQRRCSAVLSSIDNKIALNRAINQNLEALAKQLYDYWFVQFDFPNEEGKPYKSSGGKMVWNDELKREIPDRWETLYLNNWLELKSGFPFSSETYKENGKYKVITIKNVQDGYLDTSGCNFLDQIPQKAKKYIQLHEGDCLISLTGNCGRLCVVTEHNLLLNQRVGLICCRKQDYKEFAYQLFRSEYIQSICDNLANGAAQANLSPIDLCKNISLLPPKTIINSFNKSVAPIREEIIKLIQECNYLSKQRDELLPLLMNGQVTLLNCD